MRKTLLAALAAIVATLLLGVGIAVAVEGGHHQTPATDQSSSSGTGDDAKSDAPDTDDESTESEAPDTKSESEAPDTESNDANDDANDSSDQEHPENHGKHVSEAAHTCPDGPDHGACVSAVAHSDAGKK